jgi:hypothetical protein
MGKTFMKKFLLLLVITWVSLESTIKDEWKKDAASHIRYLINQENDTMNTLENQVTQLRNAKGFIKQPADLKAWHDLHVAKIQALKRSVKRQVELSLELKILLNS